MEDEIVELRKRHWGARKIRKRLQVLGRGAVPAASTITAVLHRHGLIEPESSGGRKDWQRFERSAPNDLWQTDFKAPVQSWRSGSALDRAGRSFSLQSVCAGS